MPVGRILQAWRVLRTRISDAIVQDVPPELAACEVCRKTDCRTEEWLKCEHRLAVAHYMRTGHDEAAAKAKAEVDQVPCAAASPRKTG